MADQTKLSFLTLPVYLIYRILDHASDVTIFCSTVNVCTRLNAIIESYHRYQVNMKKKEYLIQRERRSMLCTYRMSEA